MEGKFHIKALSDKIRIMVRIYIDSDSLPLQHREIVLRRIIKKGYHAWFAADRKLPDVEKAIEEDKRIRRSAFRDTLSREEARKIGSGIHMVVVESGSNAADDALVGMAEAPALAITHDIPLAARLIEKGLIVIDDRGNTFDSGNIRVRLSERENNALFREMGLFDNRSKRFDEKTMRAFSSAFDKALNILEKFSDN